MRRVIDSIPGGQYSPAEQNNKIEQLQHEISVKTELIAKYKALGTSVLDSSRNKPPAAGSASKTNGIATSYGADDQYSDNESE